MPETVDNATLDDLIHRGSNHQLTSQRSTDIAITQALAELKSFRTHTVGNVIITDAHLALMKAKNIFVDTVHEAAVVLKAMGEDAEYFFDKVTRSEDSEGSEAASQTSNTAGIQPEPGTPVPMVPIPSGMMVATPPSFNPPDPGPGTESNITSMGSSSLPTLSLDDSSQAPELPSDTPKQEIKSE